MWREIGEAEGKRRIREEKHRNNTIQPCPSTGTWAENPFHFTGVLLSLNHNPF